MNPHTVKMVEIACRRLTIQAERAETERRQGRVGVELIFKGGEITAVKETTEATTTA